MITTKTTGVPIKAWTEGVPVEQEAMDQLEVASRLPIVYPHIAVMPDVHKGIGSTVGSVIPTRKAIIPATVGVDLGCGVDAVLTDLVAGDLPESLTKMRFAIEAVVPHGRSNNGGVGDKGAHALVPEVVGYFWANFLAAGYKAITDRTPEAAMPNQNAMLNQFGTLGGGNHFIEVCLDKQQRVWVMLHSGSRGVGNRIGSTFISLAKRDMEAAHGYMPEDQDLCYLTEGTEHFDAYWQAIQWAQDYAYRSRQIMMARVLDAMEDVLGRSFNNAEMAVSCHHNYVSKENHFGEDLYVTRKGAVRADKGMLGVIPGSMGARSFIVRGKGSAESFHSCSHGAGRVMSRNEAKRRFTLEDHAKAMEGVEARLDADVIDETPASYKDILDVMNAQSDLVEIVAELKQVLVVKG